LRKEWKRSIVLEGTKRWMWMWDLGGCNDGVHILPRAGEDVVVDIPLLKRLTVEWWVI